MNLLAYYIFNVLPYPFLLLFSSPFSLKAHTCINPSTKPIVVRVDVEIMELRQNIKRNTTAIRYYLLGFVKIKFMLIYLYQNILNFFIENNGTKKKGGEGVSLLEKIYSNINLGGILLLSERESEVLVPRIQPTQIALMFSTLTHTRVQQIHQRIHLSVVHVEVSCDHALTCARAYGLVLNIWNTTRLHECLCVLRYDGWITPAKNQLKKRNFRNFRKLRTCTKSHTL
jgi:hypothetical protein